MSFAQKMRVGRRSSERASSAEMERMPTCTEGILKSPVTRAMIEACECGVPS
jgi:hypothetical protein